MSTFRLRVGLAILTAGASIHAAQAGIAGRPIADVLRDAQSTGIRIIFTDQIVPPRLQVIGEPIAREPLEQLREILRFHALALEEITPGVYVVVRNQVTATATAATVEPDRFTLPEEVEVTASRYTINSLSTQGSFGMGNVEMERQPALFNDAARSIRRFPGTAGQDMSARSFVRGGTPEENLILLDGVPLQEPFHLKSLPLNFGLIDPAVLERIDFYSGVQPVEYSGRMSSLTNMTLHEPSESLGGRLALGILDASALVSGRLPGTDSDPGDDWLAFARSGLMSSAGLVNQASNARGFQKPQMFDTLGRARFHLGDQSTLSVGALVARDQMRVSSSYDGGSLEDDSSAHRYVWSEYERRWARLSSRTMVSYTSIDTNHLGNLSDLIGYSGQLTDDRKFSSALLRQEWTLAQNDRTELRWGAATRYEHARFDYYRAIHFPTDLAAFFRREADSVSSIETSASLLDYELYAGFNRALSRWLTLDAGAHWSGVKYSTHQSSIAWDPRLGLLFDLSPATRLRLSAGRMTQTWAATDLPIEQGRLLFDERSTSNLQVLAWEHDFGPRLFVRAEIFNKHVKDPRPRVENFLFPSAVLPELRPDEVVIEPDSSHMKGFDLYATAKFTQNVSAWLSYSRSLANDRIDGEYVVRAWDQPHSGGIGLAWDRRWWLVSAEVFAHSNWPQTPVAASGPIRVVDEPIDSASNADVGVRNSERRGYYFTVNLKTEVNRSFAFGTLRFALELANATDHINNCCNDLMFFNFFSYYDDAIHETLQNRQESRSWLRVVPYATISFEF